VDTKTNIGHEDES